MNAKRFERTMLWAALLNAPTALMAAVWFVLTLFATAIGSRAPTASEYMQILWPAFGGLMLAGASLWTAFRVNRAVGALLGVAGLLIMPIAFKAMLP